MCSHVLTPMGILYCAYTRLKEILPLVRQILVLIRNWLARVISSVEPIKITFRFTCNMITNTLDYYAFFTRRLFVHVPWGYSMLLVYVPLCILHLFGLREA